jgi:hypothetical protein
MRLLTFIFISFILFSCGSSEETEEISVDLNGNMIAFINANEWVSGPNTSASVNYLTNQIHVEGFDANDGIIRSHITLKVNTTEAGTFDAQTATGIFYDVQTKSAYISENNCNVDILEMDLQSGSISGRFSFNGIDPSTGQQREILSGEFNNVNLTITE